MIIASKTPYKIYRINGVSNDEGYRFYTQDRFHCAFWYGEKKATISREAGIYQKPDLEYGHKFYSNVESSSLEGWFVDDKLIPMSEEEKIIVLAEIRKASIPFREFSQIVWDGEEP